MFQQGYLSGGIELTNHPLLYNMFRPSWFNGTDDRVFRPGDMEALLRPNSNMGQAVDSGSSTLQSDLLRLCPTNFGPSAPSPRFRNLVTTLSMELGTPGISPYWWNGMNPATAYMTANPNPLLAPFAATPALFPTLPPSATVTSSAGPSEFGPDWRALAQSRHICGKQSVRVPVSRRTHPAEPSAAAVSAHGIGCDAAISEPAECPADGSAAPVPLRCRL